MGIGGEGVVEQLLTVLAITLDLSLMQRVARRQIALALLLQWVESVACGADIQCGGICTNANKRQ